MKSEAELIALAQGLGLDEAFVRTLLTQASAWAVELIITFLKERGIVRAASVPGVDMVSACEHECCKFAAQSIPACLDGDHAASCKLLAQALACCCLCVEVEHP